MTADTLIQALLEAVEVGDDGVYLQHSDIEDTPEVENPVVKDNNKKLHYFDIMHPVHGRVGWIRGLHDPAINTFEISFITVNGHPKYKDQQERPTNPEYEPELHGDRKDDYEGLSRTFIRSGLKSLMKKIPGLKRISGTERVTGTHYKAAKKSSIRDMANTAINIPRSMRQTV